MDILSCAYYTALFFIPIVFYLTIIKKSSNCIGVYEIPNWYYFVKFVFAKPAVKKIQSSRRKTAEHVKDEPQQIDEKWISDTSTIYGVDQKGNSISIQFQLRKQKIAQITLCLRLKDGSVYLLPTDESNAISIAEYKWKAAGLTIETLEPFRRLRITYNGFARKIIPSDNAAEHATEHIQFHFILNAAGKPLHFPQDLSTNLLAEGLATESWKNGEWLQLLPDQTSYEQYGALMGFLKGENIPEEIYFNLPSWRTRTVGEKDEVTLHRYLTIVGAAEDGTVFALGVKSIKNGCSHLKYGSVIFNNGEVHPVDQHDIKLHHIAEYKDVPDIFVVHFAASTRDFKCVLHMKKRMSVTMVSSEQHGWETVTVPAECDFNTQQAKAEVTFWYSKRGTQQTLPEPLLVNVPSNNTDECIANLNSVTCRCVATSGGKGNSLALLTSLDQKDAFIVPPGFVVTVPAFKSQVSKTGNIKNSLEVLQDVAHGIKNGELSEACNRTVEVFSQETLLKEISDGIAEEMETIEQSLKGQEMENWKWAVRSSGVGEDSEELSAAGQNSTFLGCSTVEDILKAVAECWGSLYAFQSVEYRRQHGIPILTEMAVVVQKMVPSDCAGVLFTCHPASNNPGEILITSNYGLGESVVSGQADPDTIVLKRTWDGKITFHSQDLGAKSCSVVADENGSGIKTIKVDEGMTKNASISNTQARQLGRVGVLIEKAFGGPRDIEWAFYKNRLYLLQSRPITTINTWTDFELLHEFDTPVLSEEDAVLTRANCGEVLPGAITALTMSTTAQQVEECLSISVGCYDPYISKSLPINQHHAFIDAVNTVMRESSPNKDFLSKAIDIAIFGHPVGNEKMHATAQARFGLNTSLRRLKSLIGNLRLAWNSKRSKELVFQHVKRNIDIQDCYSAADIYEKIDEGISMFGAICFEHCCITRVSIFYQFLAMNILVEGSNDFRTEHYQDIALLLSSCEDLVSVQIPTVLSQIADEIRHEKVANEFLKINASEGTEWLKQKGGNAGQIFERFLKEHGHRSLREFELMEEVWEMRPEKLIELLQMNVKCGKQTTKSNSFTVDETIAKLVSPKSNVTRTILKTIMKKCRGAVADREATKSQLVRCTGKLRVAYRKLAQKMVQEGKLPNKTLIYHLTHNEIGQLLRGSQSVLVAKAVRRQRLYPQWDKMTFPQISMGLPIPETNDKINAKFMAERGSVMLYGTPVYPGELVARACVINELDNAKQLQAGDILITHCTDVGWSPYFPILGAVVTELGGLMSHGAVVAREYGLPCVIGVQNATKTFKTGDKVHLSGKIGTVGLVNE